MLQRLQQRTLFVLVLSMTTAYLCYGNNAEYYLGKTGKEEKKSRVIFGIFMTSLGALVTDLVVNKPQNMNVSGPATLVMAYCYSAGIYSMTFPSYAEKVVKMLNDKESTEEEKHQVLLNISRNSRKNRMISGGIFIGLGLLSQQSYIVGFGALRTIVLSPGERYLKVYKKNTSRISLLPILKNDYCGLSLVKRY